MVFFLGRKNSHLQLKALNSFPPPSASTLALSISAFKWNYYSELVIMIWESQVEDIPNLELGENPGADVEMCLLSCQILFLDLSQPASKNEFGANRSKPNIFFSFFIHNKI